MNYNMIRRKITDLYQTLEIESFPLDCFSIVKRYGLRLFTYEELYHKNNNLYEMAMHYSEDAFRYRDLICYNTNMPDGRIRFSLMHELGHAVLNHGNSHTQQMEQEANYFSSHMLAPRIIMYYAGCRSTKDTATLFSITKECASIAYEDYLCWEHRFMTNGFTHSDRLLYEHFYNRELHKLVYHTHHCRLCNSLLHNTTEPLCPICAGTFNHAPHIKPNQNFLHAEQSWLTPE